MSKRRTEEGFEGLIRRARATNRQRDAMDRKRGFGAPSDCPLHELARTAQFAIEAGLRGRDWDCVAEGYLMLGEVVEKLAGLSGGRGLLALIMREPK